jgi:hypothetical protein
LKGFLHVMTRLAPFRTKFKQVKLSRHILRRNLPLRDCGSPDSFLTRAHRTAPHHAAVRSAAP